MLPILIVFILILVIILCLDSRKPKNFPPGPKWYPIIGSALRVHAERTKTGMLSNAMIKMANENKENGILGLKIGEDKLVVILSSECAEEMSGNEDLDGRPTGIFYRVRTWGSRKGILLTDGEFWMEQRRFVVRHLKDFGFARRGMTEIIENEAEYILKDFQQIIKQQNGKAMIQIQEKFNMYILNTLWKMMAGVRFNHDNLQLKELQNLLHSLFTQIDMMGCLFSHFPFLRFIAPELSGYKLFYDWHQKMLGFLSRELDIHKNNFKIENNPDDLMDVYLQVLQNPNRKESFTEPQLLAVCLDMFLAGSETTTKGITFALLHLVRNPEIQRKMQHELDTVIGRQRLPVLDDRPNLPYCEAVSLEGLRIFVGYTFGIPHRAFRDTKLKGYDIPKDTMVITCFGGIFFDEKLYPKPFEFNPERFLKDGKVVIPTNFHPFGLGKRRCIGEIMAKNNLFIFIATLIQNFNFSIPPGQPIPSDIPIDGVTASIQPLIALLTNR